MGKAAYHRRQLVDVVVGGLVWKRDYSDRFFLVLVAIESAAELGEILLGDGDLLRRILHLGGLSRQSAGQQDNAQAKREQAECDRKPMHDQSPNATDRLLNATRPDRLEQASRRSTGTARR